jgi:hypothetical protein
MQQKTPDFQPGVCCWWRHSGQISDFGTGSYSYSGSSSSSIEYSAKSKAQFCAVLVDTSSWRTVWYCDVVTKAGGTWFVGSKRDAKAAAKAIVKTLKKNGHVPPQAQ